MVTISLCDPDRFRGVNKPFEELALGDRGLSWVFLDSPIRLRVEDVELFQIRGDTHIALPLLGFARWGLVALEAARMRGKYVYELPDYPGGLLMEMEGEEEVILHCTVTRRTVIANYYELHEAWLGFAEWVRQTIRQALPGIAEYERLGWNRWFAGYQHEEPQGLSDDWYATHGQCISKARVRWRNRRN